MQHFRNASIIVLTKTRIQTIIMVMKTYSISKAKAKLAELIKEVEDHESIYLTKNGEISGVLVNPHELEALKETIDILSDPKLMHQIDMSRKSRREYSMEEVFGEMV